MNDEHIATLLAERKRYAADDLTKRVAEVDRELARYGVDPEAKPKRKAKKDEVEP